MAFKEFAPPIDLERRQQLAISHLCSLSKISLFTTSAKQLFLGGLLLSYLAVRIKMLPFLSYNQQTNVLTNYTTIRRNFNRRNTRNIHVRVRNDVQL